MGVFKQMIMYQLVFDSFVHLQTSDMRDANRKRKEELRAPLEGVAMCQVIIDYQINQGTPVIDKVAINRIPLTGLDTSDLLDIYGDRIMKHYQSLNIQKQAA